MLADIDRHVHRQANAQRVRRDLLRVERDAHRHALDNFDPVAAGVLRRQQRKRRAGARAQAGDGAVKHHFAAVHIGLQRGALADAQIFQLAFFEVGIDPQVFQRHHRHQRRASRHTLSQLHAALGDVAIQRGFQLRALQRQPRFAHAGGGALHVRVLGRGGAVGLGLAGNQLLLRGAHGGLRGGGGALGAGQLRAGVFKLLFADGAGGQQRAAAVHVVFGAGDFGLRTRQIGLAQADLGFERRVVGKQRAHFAHGLRQLRLGLVEGNARVGRVQRHQHLAGADEIGVLRANGHHRPAHLRGNLHHVAGGVGVVGGLKVARLHPMPAAPRQPTHRDQSGNHRQTASADGVGFVRVQCAAHEGNLSAEISGDVSVVVSVQPPPSACISSTRVSSWRARRSMPKRRWASNGVSVLSTTK